MKESKRLEVLAEIQKELEELNEAKKLEDEIKRLENEDIIKKYLKTKLKYEELSKRVNFDLSLNERRKYAFTRALHEDTRECCEHSLLVYTGSFKIWLDPLGEHDHDILVNSEMCKGFEHNKYRCIECGREFSINSWKEYEDSHIVLKRYPRLNYEKIRGEYCYILLEHTSEEAMELLIKKYKGKSRSLKK